MTKLADNLSLFVTTCQSIPDGSIRDSSIVGTPVFKQETFPVVVASSTNIKDLQRLIVDQWVISKHLLAKLPLSDHFFTFKGRMLHLDGTLDSYYILNNDTIYVRFASLGKICDPWAMSTSELRVELKARDAYVINSLPDQLMQRLQNLLLEETRMHRLQEATRKNDRERVQSIVSEPLHLQQRLRTLNSITPREKSVERPPSFANWPIAPCLNRTVFLSIAELERTSQRVPRDVLDSALFIFDTERTWVFDKHKKWQKQHFDYRFMCFDQGFLEMLTFKEEAGLLFWFRPHKSFEQLSAFLTTIADPATKGKTYQPLILSERKWRSLCGQNGWEGTIRRDGCKHNTKRELKFTKSVARVVTNLQSGSFDYVAVKELLFQSNPTLAFAPL